MIEPVAQAQALEQRFGAGVAGRSRHARVQRRHFHIFARRFGGDQVITLEDEAERYTPQPRQFIGIQAGHVLAGEAVRAVAGPIKTPKQMHQGRFAGTGCPHDSDEFAGADRQGQAAQHFHGRRAVMAAVALADALQGNQRRQGRRLVRPS